ncbi:MAG: peptide chain release factor N(5)-glutamine methyltransferase [Chitinophagaceae bacterium]
MTIHEIRLNANELLSTIYDHAEAENIAEWLLENKTGLSKTELIAGKHQQLTPQQNQEIEKGLKRLQTHEPIQYVLNESWFCGMKFYVDKNVLIPRPETEELVEWIISNLKFPLGKISILDIGSGSGCIAIALKRKLRKADVWSCDVSANALAVAKRNAISLNADVNFVEMNFLDVNEWQKLPQFDIIVSNPPYVPQQDKLQMNKNVLDYEPHTALFVPDNDPLLFYKKIALFGKNHLNKDGAIFLELHEEYATDTAQYFQNDNYKTEIKKDMQGKQRMMKGY